MPRMSRAAAARPQSSEAITSDPGAARVTRSRMQQSTSPRTAGAVTLSRRSLFGCSLYPKPGSPYTTGLLHRLNTRLRVRRQRLQNVNHSLHLSVSGVCVAGTHRGEDGIDKAAAADVFRSSAQSMEQCAVLAACAVGGRIVLVLPFGVLTQSCHRR